MNNSTTQQEPHHDVAGVGERHPRGAGAGGPGGADRPAQSGRAARRGGAIRRPGTGGGVESQAQCPPRPAGVSGRRPGAGGPGGEEAGFWLRADRVEQDNQALRQERDGLIERIKERIAGIYREASGAPGDMETTLAARDQWIELAKPTGDNRATRTRAATAIGPSLPDSASSGTLYGQ